MLVRARVSWSLRAACLVGLLALLVPRQAPAPMAAAAASGMQVIGPGGAGAPLVSLIAGARLRVLVEAFALSDAAVVTALEAAERRGVDVRVMLDPQGLNSAATLAALQSAGIRARAPNPAYAVTHLDAVVVDAGAVAVLTTALTADALGPFGRGYMVVDGNRRDVLQAASIFYDDWLRRAVNAATFDRNLVLLPDDASQVAALIDQAGARVELYTSYLSDPGVIASLRSARQRGAVVRVLTPVSSDNGGLLLVARAGQVRFRDVGGGTLLVIDRQTVLLGSMDLAPGTLTSHRDLGIIVSGRSVAAPIDALFFSEFARGTVLVLAPPHRVRRVHIVLVGALKVVVDVSPLVRVGGEGVVAVSTAAGATVDVAITYPSGSRPAAGTTGARGPAGRRGTFVYRWILAGRVKAGLARVLIVVHGRSTVARYMTSFRVAG